MRVLLWSRCISALLFLALPAQSWAQWMALGGALLTSLALAFRQSFGEDGSDQMLLIVLVAVFACYGPFQQEEVMTVGLFFIGLQAILAYGAAGVAKFLSPVWRSGAALGLIVNTASYGSPFMGRMAEKYSFGARLVTWWTMVFEVGFALVLITPPPITAGILLLAGLFHVGVAVVMGLNNFVWAFVSTYPAVYFVSYWISP